MLQPTFIQGNHICLIDEINIGVIAYNRYDVFPSLLLIIKWDLFRLFASQIYFPS